MKERPLGNSNTKDSDRKRPIAEKTATAVKSRLAAAIAMAESLARSLPCIRGRERNLAIPNIVLIALSTS
jgi:hypothetical protein